MDHHAHEPALGLRDYVSIARRRWRWIVAVTLLTVGTALGLTFTQMPIYEATAEVLIVPVSGDSALEQALFGRTGMTTQARLITSVTMGEAVVERLELDDPPRQVIEQIAATPIGDTSVMRITATDEDPLVAATLAQGFADTYLSVRRDQAAQGRDQVRQQLAEDIQAIRDRIDQIDAELATRFGGASNQAALSRERDTLLTQLGQLTAQSSTVGVAGDVTGGGEVLLPATVPLEPISPKPLQNGILALAMGLLLGAGFAFMRDYLDDALRTDDEVRRATGGRPVLGHVPIYGGASDGGRPPLPTLVAPSSPAAEAARTLRANLRFLSTDNRLSSIAVTSAGEGEGKTTVACNLAVAAASAGFKVILVDADLRRPAVHKVFGIEGTSGLSDMIAGSIQLRDGVRDVGIENLRIVTAGQRPPNPAELLASARFKGLLSELEQLAEVVILDTAPTLPVADTLEVAHLARGTLLVVCAGKSQRRHVREAVQRLEEVRGRVIGTAVNRIDASQGYYSYAYQYGYGEPVDEIEVPTTTRTSRKPDAAAAVSAEAPPTTHAERRPATPEEAPSPTAGSGNGHPGPAPSPVAPPAGTTPSDGEERALFRF